MNSKSVSRVPLVEVIDALREDLKTAKKNSDPKNPLIIEEIEVELQVVVTKEAEGDAKAKIEVLNVGKLLGLGGLDGELNINGSWVKSSTQKIKIKLSAATLDSKTGEFKKARASGETDFK